MKVITPGDRHTRRDWLRSIGAGTALLPFLPLRRSYGAQAFPRRLILVVTPNGFWNPVFDPTGGETSFRLPSTVAALEPFRSDLIFLKGLAWQSWLTQKPQPSNDHPPPLGHMLTAADTVQVGTQWVAEGPSIDQFVAKKLAAPTKFSSVILGVKSSGDRVSYQAARTPVAAEDDPQKIFSRLFADLQPNMPPKVDPRNEDRKSVLDLVTAELGAIRRKAGGDDRAKIDAHLEAIRAIETRVSMTPTAPLGASCTRPDPSAHQEAEDYLRSGRQQMDLLAMSLACDLTRVVSLQWSTNGSGRTFPFLGFPDEHHQLTHYMGTGTEQEQIDKVAKIEAWYVDQFAYLLDLLKKIPEGDGTMLDNSLVLWTSEHGRLNLIHDRANLPFIIAGRAGGALRTGRFLTFANVSHANLYVSLCQAMGLTDVTTFGTARLPSAPLAGLL